MTARQPPTWCSQAIFPLQAVDGGVLMRAAIPRLVAIWPAMAGCSPAAVICVRS